MLPVIFPGADFRKPTDFGSFWTGRKNQTRYRSQKTPNFFFITRNLQQKSNKKLKRKFDIYMYIISHRSIEVVGKTPAWRRSAKIFMNAESVNSGLWILESICREIQRSSALCEQASGDGSLSEKRSKLMPQNIFLSGGTWKFNRERVLSLSDSRVGHWKNICENRAPDWTSSSNSGTNSSSRSEFSMKVANLRIT